MTLDYHRAAWWGLGFFIFMALFGIVAIVAYTDVRVTGLLVVGLGVFIGLVAAIMYHERRAGKLGGGW